MAPRRRLVFVGGRREGAANAGLQTRASRAGGGRHASAKVRTGLATWHACGMRGGAVPLPVCWDGGRDRHAARRSSAAGSRRIAHARDAGSTMRAPRLLACPNQTNDVRRALRNSVQISHRPSSNELGPKSGRTTRQKLPKTVSRPARHYLLKKSDVEQPLFKRSELCGGPQPHRPRPDDVCACWECHGDPRIDDRACLDRDI